MVRLDLWHLHRTYIFLIKDFFPWKCPNFHCLYFFLPTIEKTGFHETGIDSIICLSVCLGGSHNFSNNCRDIFSRWLSKFYKRNFPFTSECSSLLYFLIDPCFPLHRFDCLNFYRIHGKLTQSLQMLTGSKISFLLVIQWHFTSVMCSTLKKIKEEQRATRAGYPYVAWMWKMKCERKMLQVKRYNINTSS